MGLIASLAFAVDGTIKLKVLGRAPLTEPVANAAMAKQVVKNHIEEIRKLENDDLFLHMLDQLDQREFKEETIPVGAVMRWMLFKDKFGTIHNLKNVEWAGEGPFKAYGFEIVQGRTLYHFFVAQECGNISLYEIKKQPEKQIPPPAPQPQQPPQLTPPSQPSEPKTIPPAIVAMPQPAPIRKYHLDFKIKVGPWIPWEPLKFSANNQSIDVHHDFQEYLPKYEKFLFNENETTTTIYLNEKNFPYQSGDKVPLKQQRSMATGWSGINFNVGLEIRMWKQLWLGIDYYQSRTLHVNLSEYTEDMLFKEVKYLGYYYTGGQIFCPPRYHRYCLDLNRLANERQTNYSIMSREIHFVLRYYLNIGRFSLAPTFGLADQQFLKKAKINTVSTLLYPWKDKAIPLSEDSTFSTEKNNYQLTWTAGLTGEVKLLKFLSVAAEGSYRKFSEEKLIHESTIIPGLDSSFKGKPWRLTATIKVLF